MNIHHILFLYGREPQTNRVEVGGSEKSPNPAPVAESPPPPPLPLPVYGANEPPAPEHIAATFTRAAAIKTVAVMETDSNGAERRLESHPAVYVPATAWTPSEPLRWDAARNLYEFSKPETNEPPPKENHETPIPKTHHRNRLPKNHEDRRLASPALFHKRRTPPHPGRPGALEETPGIEKMVLRSP